MRIREKIQQLQEQLTSEWVKQFQGSEPKDDLYAQLQYKHQQWLLTQLHQLTENQSLTDEKIMAGVEHLLTENWEKVKGTFLSYTAQNNTIPTDILCELAFHVSQYHDKKEKYLTNLVDDVGYIKTKDVIQLLMPGVTTDSITGEIDLDGPPDPSNPPANHVSERDIRQVFRTHILSDNAQYLIPMDTALAYDIRDKNKQYPNQYNPSLSDDTYAYLSPNEVKRLLSHSPEVHRYIDIQKDIQHQQEEHPSLLTLLENLYKVMDYNSRGGIGDELQAGESIYSYLSQFNEEYKKYDQNQIPPEVKNAIALIQQEASTPVQMYNEERVIVDNNQILAYDSPHRVIAEGVEAIRLVTTELNTAKCLNLRKGSLREAIDKHQDTLSRLSIDGKTQQTAIATLQKEKVQLQEQLASVFTSPTTRLEYHGQDKLPITRSLCSKDHGFDIPISFTSSEDFHQVISKMTPTEIIEFFQGETNTPDLQILFSAPTPLERTAKLTLFFIELSDSQIEAIIKVFETQDLFRTMTDGDFHNFYESYMRQFIVSDNNQEINPVITSLLRGFVLARNSSTEYVLEQILSIDRYVTPQQAAQISNAVFSQMDGEKLFETQRDGSNIFLQLLRRGQAHLLSSNPQARSSMNILLKELIAKMPNPEQAAMNILNIFITNNQTDLAQTVLASGYVPTPHRPDSKGQFPLLSAIKHKNLTLYDALMVKGARLTGITTSTGQKLNPAQILQYAASLKSWACLQRMLESSMFTAEIIQSVAPTILKEAIADKQTKIVEILIAKNCLTEAVLHESVTHTDLFNYALQHHAMDIALLLFKKQAIKSGAIKLPKEASPAEIMFVSDLTAMITQGQEPLFCKQLLTCALTTYPHFIEAVINKKEAINVIYELLTENTDLRENVQLIKNINTAIINNIARFDPYSKQPLITVKLIEKLQQSGLQLYYHQIFSWALEQNRTDVAQYVFDLGEVPIATMLLVIQPRQTDGYYDDGSDPNVSHNNFLLDLIKQKTQTAEPNSMSIKDLSRLITMYNQHHTSFDNEPFKQLLESTYDKIGDVNQTDEHGNTLLMQLSVMNAPWVFFETLLRRQPNLAQQNKDGLNALHLASRHQQYDLVKHILAQNSSLIQRPAQSGITPLYEAVLQNNLNIVALMLKHITPPIEQYNEQDIFQHLIERKSNAGFSDCAKTLLTKGLLSEEQRQYPMGDKQQTILMYLLSHQGYDHYLLSSDTLRSINAKDFTSVDAEGHDLLFYLAHYGNASQWQAALFKEDGSLKEGLNIDFTKQYPPQNQNFLTTVLQRTDKFKNNQEFWSLINKVFATTPEVLYTLLTKTDRSGKSAQDYGPDIRKYMREYYVDMDLNTEYEEVTEITTDNVANRNITGFVSQYQFDHVEDLEQINVTQLIEFMAKHAPQPINKLSALINKVGQFTDGQIYSMLTILSNQAHDLNNHDAIIELLSNRKLRLHELRPSDPNLLHDLIQKILVKDPPKGIDLITDLYSPGPLNLEDIHNRFHLDTNDFKAILEHAHHCNKTQMAAMLSMGKSIDHHALLKEYLGILSRPSSPEKSKPMAEQLVNLLINNIDFRNPPERDLHSLLKQTSSLGFATASTILLKIATEQFGPRTLLGADRHHTHSMLGHAVSCVPPSIAVVSAIVDILSLHKDTGRWLKSIIKHDLPTTEQPVNFIDWLKIQPHGTNILFKIISEGLIEKADVHRHQLLQWAKDNNHPIIIDALVTNRLITKSEINNQDIFNWAIQHHHAPLVKKLLDNEIVSKDMAKQALSNLYSSRSQPDISPFAAWAEAGSIEATPQQAEEKASGLREIERDLQAYTDKKSAFSAFKSRFGLSRGEQQYDVTAPGTSSTRPK